MLVHQRVSAMIFGPSCFTEVAQCASSQESLQSTWLDLPAQVDYGSRNGKHIRRCYLLVQFGSYVFITSHLSLLVHHVFILASVKRQLFSLRHLGHGTNLRRNTADAKRGSNAMDCHRLSWPSALSHLHLKTELKQVRNLFLHVILTKIHYRFIKFVLFVTWLASILLHFPVQVDFTVSPVSWDFP